ncbi:hypothetical protein [Noviherbaspirillum autotrophicum]|uniref:hypothetical protein n=1 Tax=Noviherbaspirillum autotrophicum TaxID=709839 RepID=UPI000693CF18|nr:hypothetical protein [Noviherbaspirillum autotrophicum]
MQTGKRLRCYPAPALQDTLWQWIGAQEFIDTAHSGEDRYFRTFARKCLALAGQHPPVDQVYCHFHANAIDWIRSMPSQILRNGAATWYQAYQRFFKKLAGRPGFKQRHGRRAVSITRELFRLPAVGKGEVPAGDYALEIGTQKHPVGTIPFHVHVPFQPPNSVHLSIEHGRWHLSFSYDDGAIEPKDDHTAAWLRQHSWRHHEAATEERGRGGMLRTGGPRFAHARGDARQTHAKAVWFACAAVCETRNRLRQREAFRGGYIHGV